MITDVALIKAQEHARAEYPRESVGFIIDEEYVPQINLSVPNDEFILPATAWSNRVSAVIHSHPDQLNPYPSSADMSAQIDSAVPWGIIGVVEASEGRWAGPITWFGDQAEKLSVFDSERRYFIHGVYDCYALIRDYYREVLAITLPEFPREWNWWNEGGSLYDNGFAKAGFREVPLEAIRPHDVWLSCPRRTIETPHHGGIFLGGPGDMILHHMSGNAPVDLSRRVSQEIGTRQLVNNVKIVLRHQDVASC